MIRFDAKDFKTFLQKNLKNISNFVPKISPVRKFKPNLSNFRFFWCSEELKCCDWAAATCCRGDFDESSGGMRLRPRAAENLERARASGVFCIRVDSQSQQPGQMKHSLAFE